MPNITFKPMNITVAISKGAALIEAAKLAGVGVETPCGGKGSCGKCLVRIIGDANVPDSAAIDAEMRSDGWALICTASANDSDITIHISEQSEEGKFFDGSEDFGGAVTGEPPEFIVMSSEIMVQEPKSGDGLSDLDRLELSMKSADVSLHALTRLPEAVRADEGKLTLWQYSTGAGWRVADITIGESCQYGVAIDIGTTTVAVALVDGQGNILGCKTGYNSQIACGLDVISRINYAKTPQRLNELRTRVTDTINAIIRSLADEHGADVECIYNISIAANTVMVHLLLGIVPEYIRLSPYTPAVFTPPIYTARELGLCVCPEAPVYISPSVGSYVGGDITSGLLCTSLAGEPGEPCLFIDIGTNGEMVLGDGDFFIGCACSAGPAFEGGGIKHGMRASVGAIERVELDPATGKAKCGIIGNAQPRGMCGSGMISLTAELFRKGFIDPAGKLLPCESVSGRNFVLTNEPRITVGETDINNLLRAKAAIFSACRTLLSCVEMNFSDLSRIYIAGGFGRYLNIGDANTIGLIPDIGSDRLTFLGNSSLVGAYKTLVSESQRRVQAELAKRITYIDLSDQPNYMDEYMAALFLPHTDKGLFSYKEF